MCFCVPDDHAFFPSADELRLISTTIHTVCIHTQCISMPSNLDSVDSDAAKIDNDTQTLCTQLR